MSDPISPKAKKPISRDDDYKPSDKSPSPDRRASPLLRTRTANPSAVARKGSALPGSPYTKGAAAHHSAEISGNRLSEQGRPRGKAPAAPQASREGGMQQAWPKGKVPRAHPVSHGTSKMEAAFPPKGNAAGKYRIDYGAQTRPLHRSPTDTPATSPRAQTREPTTTPPAPTNEGIASHKAATGIRQGQQSAQRSPALVPALPPSSAVPSSLPRPVVNKPAKSKDQPHSRERVDGITHEPLPKTIYDSPGMNSLLLGKEKSLEKKPDDDTPETVWKEWPQIKKKDYLLRLVPKDQRDWEPPKVMNAEAVDEEPRLGRFAIHDLYEKWVTPLSGKKGKAYAFKASEESQQPTETEEAELMLPGTELLSPRDELRVQRLSAEEAVDTFLTERVNPAAWKHRQGLHSELRHNPAYTVEVGTDVVGSKLAQQRDMPKRGVLRVEAFDDNDYVDPYSPGAGPKDPLPYAIGLPTEQTELVALNQIGKAAHLGSSWGCLPMLQMNQKLKDRFPYLDLSWSRQPSFDDSNLNELFVMGPETTYTDFPVTESVLESHDRIRVKGALRVGSENVVGDALFGMLFSSQQREFYNV